MNEQPKRPWHEDPSIITVLCGITVLTLMVASPPWVVTYHYASRYIRSTRSTPMQIARGETKPIGYSVLWDPPKPYTSTGVMASVRVDFTRLALQAVPVVLVCGGLLFIFKIRSK